jgi:hypothetical protein
MTPRALILLADALLALHALLAAFIVLGLPVVWLGALAGWAFVRRRGWRLAHLGALAVIAAQALLGRICPLTIWEDALRRAAGTPGRYGSSFAAFWAERVFYWDLPSWVFTLLYLALLAAVAATWVLVPPRRPARGKSRCKAGQV